MAFASLPPPGKQKQVVSAAIVRQDFTAATAVAQPVAVEASIQTETKEFALQKSGANPFHVEVNHVARSGTHTGPCGNRNIHLSKAEVETDVGFRV